MMPYALSSHRTKGLALLLSLCLLVPFNVTAEIRIENIGNDRQPKFIAVNDSYAPQQVVLQLKGLYNISANKRHNPLSVVVPAKSKKEIVSLWPQNTNKPTKWSYSYNYYVGDPSARHSNYIYSLPFESDKPLKVSQTFGGKASHTDPYNYYAVDIAMPVGTPIKAARAGRVIAIEQGNISGGKRKDLLNKANYIHVLHNDGTITGYAHLRWASIRPRVGSYVKEGQILGQSGNVGYSTGPHLHFSIRKNFGRNTKSIPFRFTTGTPQMGQQLNSKPASGKASIQKQKPKKKPISTIEWSSNT